MFLSVRYLIILQSLNNNSMSLIIAAWMLPNCLAIIGIDVSIILEL